MAEALLELNQVGKTIAKKTILEPVQAQVKPGEILAICGGNAAGKSTLLRIVAGMTPPSTGNVRIHGLNWKKHRRACSRQIGYMPDQFAFQPMLTAWETIQFYATLRGADSATAAEMLNKVGLKKHRQQKVSGFSMGMRQRLLLSQALLKDPPLLVLDEPTNGLDVYWIQVFESILLHAKKQGQAVIYSTHQLDVAERTADRVMLLHEGRVLQSGTPEELRKRFGTDGLDGVFRQVISEREPVASD